MHNLIYGTLQISIYMQLPQEQHPQKRNMKTITLYSENNMLKEEAVRKAAGLVESNQFLRKAACRINWTPAGHSIDEEVFAAAQQFGQ